MPGPSSNVKELSGIDPQALPDEVLRSTQPLVLRGLVADWPAVRVGLESPQASAGYLRRFYRDATVNAMLGTPDIGGRFFYVEDLSALNFRHVRAKLDTILDEIGFHLDAENAPAIYVGSTSVETCLPGFRDENDLGFGDRDPLVSVWIGNRTRIAAHYDLPDNIACVVAGHRRFTLFPPQELGNLYVGPLDLTPAGQAISLVDFDRPDLQRFPRFAQAMAAARVVDLGPGDALFIPSLWWHQVEALDPFNLLVNYWWRDTPAHMDSPINALMHAMLSVRDLPPAQRRAWAGMFDHYVFGAGEQTTDHIPPHARGVLTPLKPDAARMLRARLLRKLNR